MSSPAELGNGDAGPGAADAAGGGGASRQRFVTRHRYVTRRAGGGGGTRAAAGGGGEAPVDAQALATVAAGLQPAQLSKIERQLFGGAKMRLYLQAR
jgi:hypothetical protein